MKNRIMVISTIVIYLGLFSSCSSQPPNDCESGTSDRIMHKCINETLNSKGSKMVDLNNDGKNDFSVSFDKDLFNGNVVFSTSTLKFYSLDPNFQGIYRFDYLATKVKTIIDSGYRPKVLATGVQVDSSQSNWLLKMTTRESNLVINSYANLSSGGNTVYYKDGPFDLGEFYIAFRFYDLEGPNVGWKNGWILLDATIDRLIIKEIAFQKMPETSIKIGEK